MKLFDRFLSLFGIYDGRCQMYGCKEIAEQRVGGKQYCWLHFKEMKRIERALKD